MPTKEKSELIQDWLRKARKHKKKWPEPSDAELILNLHFSVHSYYKGVFHADATLEIPVWPKRRGPISRRDVPVLKYFSVTATDKTRAGSLRAVIEQMENSHWFHFMRAKGVRFKVTGELEKLYRGYL